jgi:hypothetical protein
MFKFLPFQKNKNKKIYKNKYNQVDNASKFDKVYAPTSTLIDQEPKKRFSLPRFQLLKFNKNKIAIYIIGTLLFSSIGYLTLVDRYFLVKNINILFPTGSYLSKNDTIEFKTNFENSYFSMFAKNSIWFISSPVLTSMAQEINPTIESVEIVERVLPNTLKIKVKTEPILATIAINDTEYWRVSKSGKFVTEDDIGLQQDLITINTPIIWNKANYKLSEFNINNVDGQLDKLYFVNYVKKIIEEQGYKLTKTIFNSLEDNNVNFVINNNTVLKFDHTKISIFNTNNRLVNILNNKKINEKILQNEVSYLDFRISENVFLCEKNKTC